MKSETRTFKRDKETKHTVVFSEVSAAGVPPVIGTVYVQKWFAGEEQAISITVGPVKP